MCGVSIQWGIQLLFRDWWLMFSKSDSILIYLILPLSTKHSQTNQKSEKKTFLVGFVFLVLANYWFCNTSPSLANTRNLKPTIWLSEKIYWIFIDEESIFSEREQNKVSKSMNSINIRRSTQREDQNNPQTTQTGCLLVLNGKIFCWVKHF